MKKRPGYAHLKKILFQIANYVTLKSPFKLAISELKIEI